MENITDEELARALLNDPFAAASSKSGNVELRNGELHASREVIRSTWPFKTAAAEKPAPIIIKPTAL